MPVESDPTPLASPTEQEYSPSLGSDGIADVLAKMAAGQLDLDVSAGEPFSDVSEAGSQGAAKEATAAAELLATAPEAAVAAPGLPSAEERKAYIANIGENTKAFRAAKAAQRQAQAAEARAADAVAKAEAFQRSAGNWQQDPMALIRAAGADPDAYMRALADQAIHGAVQTPVDPVEEKIKAAVAPYARQMEELAAEQQRHALLQQESAGIASRVLPVIAAQPDQYEALMAEHGGDMNKVAIYVYSKMKAHHAETGEFIPADEAAQQLEDWHFKRLEAGLMAAKNLKKAQQYFGTQSPTTAQVAAVAKPAAAPVVAKAAPSPTLTADKIVPVRPQSPNRGANGKFVTSVSTKSSGNKDLDEVLAHFGVK